MAGFGIGFGFGARASGRAWTPANLFGAAPGDFWDFSDPTTLFQDTAGTIPVTATGQSVARVNGKLGRYNFVQATAGHRPLFSALPNGKLGLQFDGVDDGLYVTSFDLSGTDEITALAGARRTANPAAAAVMLEFSPSAWDAASGTFISSLTSTGLTNFGLKGTTAQQTIGNPAYNSVPASYVLGGRGKIATPLVQYWGNGALYNQHLVSMGTGNLGNHQLWLGKRNPAGGATYPFTGFITRLPIIGRQLSTAEMAQLSAWANAATGAY